jgi:hypothetical protein
MGLPQDPVTLLPAHIEELNGRLSTLRHNVNNHLSLIVAATELIRRNPQLAPRMLDTLSDQPEKIIEELRAFSDELEKLLQITRT